MTYLGGNDYDLYYLLMYACNRTTYVRADEGGCKGRKGPTRGRAGQVDERAGGVTCVQLACIPFHCHSRCWLHNLFFYIVIVILLLSCHAPEIVSPFYCVSLYLCLSVSPVFSLFI